MHLETKFTQGVQYSQKSLYIRLQAFLLLESKLISLIQLNTFHEDGQYKLHFSLYFYV